MAETADWRAYVVMAYGGDGRVVKLKCKRKSKPDPKRSKAALVTKSEINIDDFYVVFNDVVQ